MKKLILPILLALVLTGCAAKKPVSGSANSFDSDTYLTLVTTDSVIKSTKAQLNSGAFPPGIVPNIKATLNALIKAYDIADTAYLTYHTAALGGVDTPAQKADVTSKLTAVQVDTSALTSITGVKQ